MFESLLNFLFDHPVLSLFLIGLFTLVVIGRRDDNRKREQRRDFFQTYNKVGPKRSAEWSEYYKRQGRRDSEGDSDQKITTVIGIGFIIFVVYILYNFLFN